MRLGPFELSVRLWEGPTSNTFLARSVDRPGFHTIEILKPHLAARPDHVARLFREARAGAALFHPHILKTIAFSQVNGVHCLVREHLFGVRLSEILKAHPLPMEVGLGIMKCALSALEHAKNARIEGSIAEHVLLGFDRGVKLFGFEEAPSADLDQARASFAAEMGIDPASAARPDPNAIAPFLAGLYGPRIDRARAALGESSSDVELAGALEAELPSPRELPGIPGGATNLDPLGLFSAKPKNPPPVAMTGFAPLPKRDDSEE